MPAFQQDKILAIVALWEKKEKLTPELKAYWMSLTNMQRREIRRDYHYEVDDDI